MPNNVNYPRDDHSDDPIASGVRDDKDTFVHCYLLYRLNGQTVTEDLLYATYPNDFSWEKNLSPRLNLLPNQRLIFIAEFENPLGTVIPDPPDRPGRYQRSIYTGNPPLLDPMRKRA